jgi:murein DD-endopeptidase MepM/ murein hydrolase activator NlpD/3D (Asp-Asp-Asp) domain-containing protein
MMELKKKLSFIFLGLLLFLISSCTFVGGNQNTITVYGYGKMVPNQVGSYAMALEAAKTDAQYNAAEIISGFELSGNTTVEKYKLKDKTIDKKLHTFLKGLIVSDSGVDKKNKIVWVKIELNVDKLNTYVFNKKLVIPGVKNDPQIKIKDRIKEKPQQVKIKTTDIQGHEKTVTLQKLPYIWPINNYVISKFGWKNGTMRYGIQIQSKMGDMVKSSREGIVIFAGYIPRVGNAVFIQHKDGWESRYEFLDKIYVKRNQHVNQGDLIGTVGRYGLNDGYVHATSLRFDLREKGQPKDPIKYLHDPLSHLKPEVNLVRVFQSKLNSLANSKKDYYMLTAYTAGKESTDKDPSHPLYGITASGEKAEAWKTIAADPSISFGTVVYIPYFRNKPNRGIFVVKDRGGAIKGKHFDIFMPQLREALQFGVHRNEEVYFIGKEK